MKTVVKCNGYLNETELTIEDIKKDRNLNFYITGDGFIQKESGYVIIKKKVYSISIMDREYIHEETKKYHKLTDTSNGIFFEVIFDEVIKFENYIELVMVTHYDL